MSAEACRINVSFCSIRLAASELSLFSLSPDCDIHSERCKQLTYPIVQFTSDTSSVFILDF